jgi:lipopolysaccharide transport system ATP-binding protein
MNQAGIRASNLGKRYRLGASDRHTPFETLRETLAALVRRQRRRDAADPGTFWALKDVSFEVGAGEVVGIIGDNGAGKSTLLKVLSRITEPTEGEAEILGRVGSLLEVGTGFHPELTGRENVYLSGSILGMRRAEITRQFDEIVSFSGMERFLDTPVKRYSSGMYMRLGFAVAAHLAPDTLIVDEILAVGDVTFQKKCLGKMSDVARHGRTVLFVSHNMGAVRSLCTRGLVMHQGTMRFDGTADDAIAHYLASSKPSDGERGGELTFGPGGLDFPTLRLHRIRLVDGLGEVRAIFDAIDPIRIEIEYEVKECLRGARAILTVSTQEGELAFLSTDHSTRDSEQQPGRYRTSCTIPGKVLNRRMYTVAIAFDIPAQAEQTLVPSQRLLSFMISGGGNQGSTYLEAWPGVVCPSLDWVTDRIP